MTRLVSLEQAKAHLRIDDDEQDTDLDLKLRAASARVLRHIDTDQDFLDSFGEPEEDSAGDAIDIPEDVQIATLLLLGYFWRDRDGENAAIWDPGFLPPAVTSILYPFRTPTLA